MLLINCRRRTYDSVDMLRRMLRLIHVFVSRHHVPKIDPLSSGCDQCDQCDQIKIAKFLQKLPKNDFARKMIDFGTFTKIA